MERTPNDKADTATPTSVDRHEAEHSQKDARSGYGAVPGEELPVAVYVSVFVAFLWVVMAAWFAFARGDDADLALGMASVLTVVFFALPILMRLTARAHPRKNGKALGDFPSRRIEIATGTLSAGSAWLQIVLIPAALALAATLIGAASLLVH